MREIDQWFGPVFGEAVAVLAILLKQPGPEAEGYRESRWREAVGLPGVDKGNDGWRGFVAGGRDA